MDPRAYAADIALAAIAVLAGFLLLPIREATFAAALALPVAAVAAVDRRDFVIPLAADVAIAIGGLAFALVDAPGGSLDGLLDALARAAAAGLFLWSLRFAHRMWRGEAGLGLGDVELAAAGALWIGWAWLLPVLEIAVTAALVAVAVAALASRRRPRADQTLPLVLFLAPAIWLGFVLERLEVAGRLPRLW